MFPTASCEPEYVSRRPEYLETQAGANFRSYRVSASNSFISQGQATGDVAIHPILSDIL